MGLTDTNYCQVKRCDKQWDRHPILEIKCPQCGAEVGELCKRPSGHQPWGKHGRFHSQRYYDALDAGHFGECPLDRCPQSSAESKKRQEENQSESEKTTTSQQKLPI